MRPGHARERPMGIRYYASATPGTGGRLKADPTDFRVTERPGLEVEPLDADPGDYPFLVVEATATGYDTTALLAAIADGMDVHPQRLAVSGTKDANAVTTQWLTIRQGTVEALPELAGVELRPVGRLGRQLDFGDHRGNAFDIVVRGAAHPGRIDAIADELASGEGVVAVPNYFGHQRFGARRTITHVVGRHLLRGDHRAAVETYLTATSPHEPDRTRRARRAIDDALADGDPAAGLAATPGYLQHERRMLAALDEHGADAHREAFETLPWSLKRLFVHAVQSHAFNECVSERLRRGIALAEVHEGDVVCFLDDDGRVDPGRAQPVTPGRLPTARRHRERGRAVVVGPLVGGDTPPPTGVVGDIHRAVLDGLGIDRHAFADNPVADVEGTWRPLHVTTALEVTGDPPRFTFELPPGAYATVVLREFLKVDPLAMV